jgi:hypothetical protein
MSLLTRSIRQLSQSRLGTTTSVTFTLPWLPLVQRTTALPQTQQFVKSLFIDMDGYASKKDAALALNAFLEKTGLDALGTPYVVGSGGGLHCYWPLTEAVPIETWKPVAENFKRLCKQESLAIDMTVTADAARVLRVPGTTNFKKKYATPRPVRILTEGDTFQLRWLATLIRDKLLALCTRRRPCPSLTCPVLAPLPPLGNDQCQTL